MKRLALSRLSPIAVAALCAVCGCSTVIGADFDVERIGGGASTGGSGATMNATGGDSTGTGGVSATGGAADGGSASGGISSSGGANGGGATGGAAAGGSGGTGTGGALVGDLVINEIAPTSQYIEIFNTNPDMAHDLTGYAVVKDGTAMRYPAGGVTAGTQIAAGGFYVFVVDFVLDELTTYKLVDASDTPVAWLELPSLAGSFIGTSWSRLPDGDPDTLAWELESQGSENEQ